MHKRLEAFSNDAKRSGTNDILSLRDPLLRTPFISFDYLVYTIARQVNALGFHLDQKVRFPTTRAALVVPSRWPYTRPLYLGRRMDGRASGNPECASPLHEKRFPQVSTLLG